MRQIDRSMSDARRSLGSMFGNSLTNLNNNKIVDTFKEEPKQKTSNSTKLIDKIKLIADQKERGRAPSVDNSSRIALQRKSENQDRLNKLKAKIE